MNKSIFMWMLVSLGLTACATSTPAPPTVTQSPIPAPTETSAALPSPSPTDAQTPVSAPHQWIGQGVIRDAVILPGTEDAAIAMSLGVLYVKMEGALIQWWVPTDLPIVALTASPDGTAVAALLQDRSILILDASTGQEIAHYATADHATTWSADIAWSPDGKHIAFQSYQITDRTDPVLLLDPQTGETSEVPNSTPKQNISPLLVWSPDSRTITDRTTDSVCSGVIDVQTGEIVVQPEAIETDTYSCHDPVVWSPDGSLVVRPAWNGEVDLFDVASGKVIRTFDTPFGFNFNFERSAVFNEDGSLLAGGGTINDFFGTLYPLVVWNVRDNQLVGKLDWIDYDEKNYTARWNTRIVSAFRGDTLYSIHGDGEISRWNFREGWASAHETIGQIPLVWASQPIRWSPDNSLLASGDQYGSVAIWSRSGGIHSLYGPPFTDPTFSPDSHLLSLIDSEKNELILKDLQSGETIQTLPDATPRGTLFSQIWDDWGSIAFSPDGTEIAYRSGNKILIANIASGERLAELEVVESGKVVTRTIWSPRGDALVGMGGDPDYQDNGGKVVVWKRQDDGSFDEIFHTENEFFAYGLTWGGGNQALFNPSGNLAAVQTAYTLPSGQHHAVTILDLDSGKTEWAIPDHLGINTWLSDDVVVTTANIGGWMTRFTNDVSTQQSDGKRADMVGDETYFGPYFVRPLVAGMAIQNWQTAKAVFTDSIYSYGASNFVWSPDGRYIAGLASDTGAIQIWDVEQLHAGRTAEP